MKPSLKDLAFPGASEHLPFPISSFPWFLFAALTVTLHLGLEKAAWLYLIGAPEVALLLLIMVLEMVLFGSLHTQETLPCEPGLL